MDRIYYIIALSLVIFGCHSEMEEDNFEDKGNRPFEYMYMQRAYPNGTIKTDASKKAAAWKNQQSNRQTSELAIWELAGPLNIGGRVTDIEIPIDQADVYYVGTASGGIFKTTDRGNSWTPIFDDMSTLAIGDIEISKTNSNTIWVGSGEVNAGGGSLAYDGDGIYKSDDAGVSWTNLGLSEIGSNSKVVIDPNDDNTVFVGAMGALFKNDENRGVYKTSDGGISWEKVFFVSDSTGVIDMVNHPTNSNILYAATWERVRRPRYRTYGGPTSGIYRSLDGGTSWHELTNGLPALAREKGRISIAISQSNPDVLYTRYANRTGVLEGVFRSNDGGENWIEVNSQQLTTVSFHWWFRGISVDPTDENTIFNNDLITQKSIDGGNTWIEAFDGVHVDQHAMAFNNMRPGEVLLGNDGGLYRSTNGGATSTKFFNLPITQFYRAFVDPQNGSKIYGGTQDNSTIRTTTRSLDDWQIINGGDGFQPLVDPNNSNVIYALSQNGRLVKSIDNGSRFSSATSGISSSDRNNWDTPIVFDPQNSEILYYSTQRVWKTTNAARSWTPISPDLTNGSGGGNISFGTITTIDVSPLDPNILIAGTDDSNVWITLDGGINWKNISSTLPDLWTTKVLADRENANTLYVTFSGYRYGEGLGHIFKSIDAGNSWIDIGSTLPDIPVNDILKDVNGNMYIATDVGVFSSKDEGSIWTTLGDNIPSVVITDLHIQEAEEELYAATYGRSLYKIDIREEPILNVNDDLFARLNIYPNPASEIVTITIPESINAMHVVIYDLTGKSMLTKTIQGVETTINTSQFTKGVYYISVSVGAKSTLRKLIIN